ncbi:hypothetical protein HNP48_002263 [Acidovorax soli]|uniref:Uncharacterized protein n=1 Tax=Acidovorax soli TaxID=592050 RepID=A0A7X0PDK3_9BURK|nr:hypothetical protein [Acidovorax soli]
MAYSTEGWGTGRDGRTRHCDPYGITWAADHPAPINPQPWSAYAAIH